MVCTEFSSILLAHHSLRLTSLLQCRTHCLLLRLSLCAVQSVYRLSLSCCSAEHSVCYCASPSLLHSQCTVCLCPAAVQNTLSATAPLLLCCTVSIPCVSVLLQCTTHCLLLCLTLCAVQSVYHLSLSCCSAEHTVCYCACLSLLHSQCAPCLSCTLRCIATSL
jgi:hypothetical protein